MEGPVLTESEVWKVGSETSTSINPEDRSIDYPLINDTDEKVKAPESAVQEEIIQQSVNPPELRIEDLSSPQTEMEVDDPACKERCKEMCIDQEITILVTNHDCNLEEEEDEDTNEEQTACTEAVISSVDVRELIDEDNLDGSIVVANMIEVSQIQKTNVVNNTSTNTTTEEQPKSQEDPDPICTKSNPPQESDVCSTQSLKDQPTQSEDVGKVDANKSEPAKEKLDLSRSPIRTQHVQTQVSLEVMYHSVATSPMTPPEASGTFIFPSTFGKLANKCNQEDLETKNVEMHSVATAPMTPLVLNAPETHSVATAPMTPLVLNAPELHSIGTAPMTPTVLNAPEMHSTGTAPMTPTVLNAPEMHSTGTAPMTPTVLNAPEMHSIGTAPMTPIVLNAPEMCSVATAPMTPVILTAPEVIPEPEPRIGIVIEDSPEPVQEVSWDEKGMTWEVYGAVVEVAVLGTAIQKHLEKQVKKQKIQPGPIDVPCVDLSEISTPMPSSPPPISGSAENIQDKGESEEKPVQIKRRRQNHVRQWFRSIRRPSCCSRPRQDEE
ncbi:G protein-regulated inducer of neurite outgrowth 1 [Danio rerio]|uniref:G protein-regulated inducer of neurite outgrowth 1 n=1 Tax=Danio rerio TaxID=7955 RepID=A0AC58H8X3_DANRE|nr:G protein-regulated inducer of neurite outgrowth 1 [Danio rerio]|eukprot:XP_005170814.1 G protein-regulated inducer of neurite outgrowth 1 [Danio rerio]